MAGDDSEDVKVYVWVILEVNHESAGCERSGFDIEAFAVDDAIVTTWIFWDDVEEYVAPLAEGIFTHHAVDVCLNTEERCDPVVVGSGTHGNDVA